MCGFPYMYITMSVMWAAVTAHGAFIDPCPDPQQMYAINK